MTTLTSAVARRTLVLPLAGALVAALATSACAGASGAAAKAARAAPARSWPLTLSAAPDDLALAQLSFRGGSAAGVSPRSLRAAASAPFGDDYLAVAQVARAASPGALRLLVLLVDRPSPLEDPVDVHVHVLAPRALGTPVTRIVADPLSRASSGSAPALCDLRLHGRALAASQVSSIAARGSALAGFDATSAVARAYDAVCSLAPEGAFEQAVRDAGASTPGAPSEGGEQPSSPSSPPPVGELPGEGCEAKPGYACPVLAGGARTAR
ncbi:MAG TPA: hypothetical protein VKV16_02895 [Solirubrobacteraceae bacterium]|nr:hypothetical protein [Solirubrobacteraceae bacterium]